METTNIKPNSLEKIGGRRWTSGSMDRVYFNDLAAWLGLEYTTYKSGNVSGAKLNGEDISNGSAKRLLADLSSSKFWFDCNTGEFASKFLSDERAETIKANVLARLEALDAE